jgi:hypothetical protein
MNIETPMYEEFCSIWLNEDISADNMSLDNMSLHFQGKLTATCSLPNCTHALKKLGTGGTGKGKLTNSSSFLNGHVVHSVRSNYQYYFM